MNDSHSQRKISMVDYIACSGSERQPVGHSLKVIKEYQQLLQDTFEMEYIAPANYLEHIKADNRISLPFYTKAVKSGTTTIQNICSMLKSFFNIHMALSKTKNNIVWFYNVDQFLFMYLGIFGLHKKKIIVTCFAQEYPKKYHNYYFQKVVPKLGLMISSNPDAVYQIEHLIKMPDYLYKKALYDKYVKTEKEQKVVCVGTMNRSKQIKELVEQFQKIKYPLEIYGYFYDDNYYQEIMEHKPENVKIDNRYIKYQEYLQILGSATYAVLPYKQEAYANFTSGVILESIFLDTVPITCKSLLNKMKINGISYVSMEELSTMDYSKIDTQNLVKLNRQLIEEQYDEKIYQNEIEQRIKAL